MNWKLKKFQAINYHELNICYINLIYFHIRIFLNKYNISNHIEWYSEFLKNTKKLRIDVLLKGKQRVGKINKFGVKRFSSKRINIYSLNTNGISKRILQNNLELSIEFIKFKI